jgi:hypothetical protein
MSLASITAADGRAAAVGALLLIAGVAGATLGNRYGHPPRSTDRRLHRMIDLRAEPAGIEIDRIKAEWFARLKRHRASSNRGLPQQLRRAFACCGIFRIHVERIADRGYEVDAAASDLNYLEVLTQTRQAAATPLLVDVRTGSSIVLIAARDESDRLDAWVSPTLLGVTK